MLSSLQLPIINGRILSERQLSSSNFDSSAGFKLRLQQEQDVRLVHNTFFIRLRLQQEQDVRLFPRRRSRAIRVLANPNVSPDKGDSKKEVIMVDPLEAKRLAAKQMERIKAKEKLKKRRQIEAINGAWAMIGLTAGLVVEGHTGNSIITQLAGYWDAFVGLFVR